MSTIHAYASREPRGPLEPYDFEVGDLGSHEVEIEVEHCGLCYSDISMLDDEWDISEYPLVPGHEIIGRVRTTGGAVSGLEPGDLVGVGWICQTCKACEWCTDGDPNLCASAVGTIVGRHGGFADRVRVPHDWVFPIPAALNRAASAPLLCGGVTVFNSLKQCEVRPTDRVGVIGLGGLGHMAVLFLRAWGCEVTVFSSSPDKEGDARAMGASRFVNSRDKQALASVAGRFDFILSTVNAELDWGDYITALRPKGRLHIAGISEAPLTIPVFPLLMGQKTVSSSPDASPTTMREMLRFAELHDIEPIVETMPFTRVNEAVEKIRNGKPKYRIVLTR